ncbi:MAG TPA: PLP-dependent aminotransferase family protein [Solirubrobacteraceae bacterium]|jgi:2-aminoadipate transaminase|nr:PLP-dependent aminotransferase family protein [Solirubrobacteraceae bacterium]
MEQELAQTLAALQRKLHELERTLHGMSVGEPLEATDELFEATDKPPQAEPWLGQLSGASRIVDETIEHLRPPRPAPAAAADRRPAPAGAPWPPRSPQPPTTSGSPSLGGSPSPEHAPEAHSSPQTGHAPQTGRAPQPPGAAELLRFRERLEHAARELTHDYDELLGRLSYAAVPSTTGPTISFARGAPSLDIVDVDGLRDAAVRAFESDPAGTTAYGTSTGYPRLRSWIADRHGVEPERVLVTNGSMQADAFLFEQLVKAGDEVIVERPTYDRTLLSLRGRGARVHAVQLEPDGIDTDALAELLAVGGAGARPTLAHIIPNFQNPAGYTLSLEKRTRLLELAAEHSFIVFEDDPYVDLRFSGEPLPTMLSMDPERVVYASSFSKTVCPGIRVGYLVGPLDLIASIAKLATNTYISPNMVAQSIVYEFSASGAIERSIETVKSALGERAQALANALRSELADAEFVVPQGGYFMWVTLPEGTDVSALFDAAAERGVSFVKGTDFMLDGGENTLRLAYSGVTPEQIDVGIARLADAYRSL